MRSLTHPDNTIQVYRLVAMNMNLDATAEHVYKCFVLQLFRKRTQTGPIPVSCLIAIFILLQFYCPCLVIDFSECPNIVHTSVPIHGSRIFTTSMSPLIIQSTSGIECYETYFICLHRGRSFQSILSELFKVKGGSNSFDDGVRSTVSRSLITKP